MNLERKTKREARSDDPFLERAFEMIKAPPEKVQASLDSASGFHKRLKPKDFIQRVTGNFDLEVMRHPKIIDLAFSHLASGVISAVFQGNSRHEKLEPQEITTWIDEMNGALEEAGWAEEIKPLVWVDVYGRAINRKRPLDKLEIYEKLNANQIRAAQLSALGDLIENYSDNSTQVQKIITELKITTQELVDVVDERIISVLSWSNYNEAPRVMQRAMKAGYRITERMKKIAQVGFVEKWADSLFADYQMSKRGEKAELGLIDYVRLFKIPPEFILEVAQQVLDPNSKVGKQRFSGCQLKPKDAMLFLAKLTGQPVKTNPENPLFTDYQISFLAERIKDWFSTEGTISEKEITEIKNECKKFGVAEGEQKVVVVRAILLKMREKFSGGKLRKLLPRLEVGFSLTPQFVESVNHKVGKAWRFYTDQAIPTEIRDEVSPNLAVIPDIAKARLTYALSPEEYIQAREDKNEAGTLDLNSDGEPSWEKLIPVIGKQFNEERGERVSKLELGVQVFGSKTMMLYMNKPQVQRYNAIRFVDELLAVQQKSGLTPKEFADNIMLQVVNDHSETPESSYYEFANVCEELVKEKRSPDEMLRIASEHPEIRGLTDALITFTTVNAEPFSSWEQLKRYYIIVHIMNENAREKGLEQRLRLHASLRPDNVLLGISAATAERAREGDRRHDDEREKMQRYRELLQQHFDLDQEVRQLEGIARTRRPTDKGEWKLAEVDEQRHTVHLDLLAEGARFGKNAADVAVDLQLLYGDTRAAGISIPMIAEVNHNIDFEFNGLRVYDYLKKTSDFSEVQRLAEVLTNTKKWSETSSRDFMVQLKARLDAMIANVISALGINETDNSLMLFRETIGMIELFLKRKFGEDLVSRLRDNMLWLSEGPDFSFEVENLMPDEVVLVFGVETSPEAYDDEANPGKDLDYDDGDYPEEKNRQNTMMFSAHFVERMHGMRQLVDDEPMVRLWASGHIEGHNNMRYYGAAVRRKFLPTILTKIRQQKDRYWGGEEDVSGALYIIDMTSGEWDWRDARTREVFDPAQTPEVKSIPEAVIDRELWDSMDSRANRSDEEIQKRGARISQEQKQRILTILNA